MDEVAPMEQKRLDALMIATNRLLLWSKKRIEFKQPLLLQTGCSYGAKQIELFALACYKKFAPKKQSTNTKQPSCKAVTHKACSK
jgi:hypothetical protein